MPALHLVPQLEVRSDIPSELSHFEKKLHDHAQKLGIRLPSLAVTPNTESQPNRQADSQPGPSKNPNPNTNLTLSQEALIQTLVLHHLDLPKDSPSPYEVEKLPDGTYRLSGTPELALQIAHAQSKNFSLCALGDGIQSIHILPLCRLSESEWAKLLGGAHPSVLSQLQQSDPSFDHAATRLHCAV
ncbi:hypothetical protein EBZ37_12485, partial [bacterium]|nr:hypothetical protein [bacterium]